MLISGQFFENLRRIVDYLTKMKEKAGQTQLFHNRLPTTHKSSRTIQQIQQQETSTQQRRLHTFAT